MPKTRIKKDQWNALQEARKQMALAIDYVEDEGEGEDEDKMEIYETDEWVKGKMQNILTRIDALLERCERISD
jgi:hypothetical protein